MVMPNSLWQRIQPRPESEISALGLKSRKTWIGNYFTSLEMVGATLTVMALDDELKTLLDVETRCTILL